MGKSSFNGTVEIFFSRTQINGVLYMLDCFVKADETNKYAYFAKKLKANLLDYGRAIKNSEEEYVVVHLYKKEVATLINLTSFFLTSIIDVPIDYFSEFNKKLLKEKNE